MNIGTSPYHAIKAIFCRGPLGNLLSIEGRDTDLVASQWPQIMSILNTQPSTPSILPSGTTISISRFPVSKLPSLQAHNEPASHIYTVRELSLRRKGCYVGLLSCCPLEEGSDERAFREWVENFILLETTLSPTVKIQGPQSEAAIRTTDTITSLFTQRLRNIASHDEWDVGVDLFRRRVLDFVIQKKRIQMAVPAFPCKSTNTRKVGGIGPDGAERLALQTLQEFAREVKQIHPPGVTVWIISDGHVFSDCIGVDDEAISDYDRKLQDMYHSMVDPGDDHDNIRFQGLTDMISSNPNVRKTLPQQWVESFPVDHPIKSSHSNDAETARKIMMAGFQPSREHFRHLISTQDPPTLSLYRGQARFMQDDLSTPDFLQRSPKQRKKLSFVVASEMIARNQAYSNLVELLLPNYVRLSIHAHSNRGPKFGIRLFPRDKVKAIDSLQDRHETVPAYEFQLPTPWHNSIIEVEGDDLLYLGKASIVHEAIERGDFEGGWVDDEYGGGRFVLRSTFSVSNSPLTAASSASTLSVNESDGEATVANRNSVSTSSTLSVCESEKSKVVEKPDIVDIAAREPRREAAVTGSKQDGQDKESRWLRYVLVPFKCLSSGMFVSSRKSSAAKNKHS